MSEITAKAAAELLFEELFGDPGPGERLEALRDMRMCLEAFLALCHWPDNSQTSAFRSLLGRLGSERPGTWIVDHIEEFLKLINSRLSVSTEVA